jgi:hypothetical protein
MAMTMRDVVAAQVMAQLVSSLPCDKAAELAYRAADALLAARVGRLQVRPSHNEFCP